MHTFIKVFVAIAFCISAPQASAEFLLPVDAKISCTNIPFPCGSGAIIPGLSDNFLGGPYEQRAAMEFSLAGLTTINDATLRMVTDLFTSYPDIFVNDPVLEIHGYAGDGEVQLTDLYVDNLIFTTEPITELGVYTFDVTSFVAGLVASGADYAGFSFRTIVMNSGVSFYGSNSLIVNIPEPEQYWLIMGGLAALLARFGGGRLIKRVQDNNGPLPA